MNRILEIVLMIIAIIVMVYTAAHGQEFDWKNKQTQLWLARAAIAEAGWPVNEDVKTEHAAIWHSLLKRWENYSRVVDKPIQFSEFIRLYCSGLGYNEPRTPRQLWIRNLDLSGGVPMGWPENVSWKYHYKHLWFQVLREAARFSNGLIPNPCPGASHFGNVFVGDVPKGRMVLHRCNFRFGNQFYRVQK